MAQKKGKKGPAGISLRKAVAQGFTPAQWRKANASKMK